MKKKDTKKTVDDVEEMVKSVPEPVRAALTAFIKETVDEQGEGDDKHLGADAKKVLDLACAVVCFMGHAWEQSEMGTFYWIQKAMSHLDRSLPEFLSVLVSDEMPWRELTESLGEEIEANAMEGGAKSLNDIVQNASKGGPGNTTVH